MDGDVIVTGTDVWVVCTLRCRRRNPSFYIHAAVYRFTSSTTGSEYYEWLHCGWLQVHVRSARPAFCRQEEMRTHHDDKVRPVPVHVILNPYLREGDAESSR